MESKKRGRPIGVRNGQLKTGACSRPNILSSNQCTKRYRTILPRDSHASLSGGKTAEQSEEGGFLVDCDVLSGQCYICMKTEKVLNLRTNQEKEEIGRTVTEIIGKRISSSYDLLICLSCFKTIKSYRKAQETWQVLSGQLCNEFANGELVKSAEFWSGRKTSVEILNKNLDQEKTVTVIKLKLNNLDMTDCDINLKYIQLDSIDEPDIHDLHLCQLLIKCSRLNVELDLDKDFCQKFDMNSSTIHAREINDIVERVSFGVNGFVKLSLHKSEFNFDCGECKEGFSNIHDCIKHVNKHELQQWISINGDGVQCKFCGRCFKTESSLTNHIAFHHPIRKYKCEYCGDEFINKLKIKNHIKEHIIYFCSYCNETFINEEYLNSHMTENHSLTINEANLNENSNCNEILNACDIIEIKTLDGWICQVCKKLFQRKSNYNEHLQRHLGIGDKPCPYCGHLFFASSLRKHIVTKHAEEDNKESLDKKLFKTSSCLLHCDVCSLNFKSQGDLADHKKSVHLNILCDSISQFGVSQMLEDQNTSVDFEATNSKELSLVPESMKEDNIRLKFEENNFPLPTILKIMEKTLYHCPLCSKIFQHLKSYQLHIQSKHINPFLCSICRDCTFSTSVQLKTHQENCKFVFNIETANQAQQC